MLTKHEFKILFLRVDLIINPLSYAVTQAAKSETVFRPRHILTLQITFSPIIDKFDEMYS